MFTCYRSFTFEIRDHRRKNESRKFGTKDELVLKYLKASNILIWRGPK